MYLDLVNDSVFAPSPEHGTALGLRQWYRAQRRGAWRSLVSALVWGTRGPEFESRRPDTTKAPETGAFVILGIGFPFTFSGLLGA